MRSHVPETGWIPVEANGLTFAVFDDGEGPLVVLQHGFPDTAHTWDPIVPSLVDAGYRVVRPFGRGIAPTEIPADGAYHLRDQVADLHGLVTALGDSAIVVGHDWGGAAAWGLAQTHPECIDKLAVVAIPHPATVPPSPGRIWNVRHFFSHKLPGATRRFARDDFARIRTLYERWSPAHDWDEATFEHIKNAYAAPDCLSAALGYYRQLWSWPFRGKVPCDTLLFGGETDIVSVSDFERSRRIVTGEFRLEILPGGHFLHLEHPDLFAERLLSWLP